MKSTKHVSCNCGHLRHEHFEGGFCNKCGCTWYHPNDAWIIKQKNDQYVRTKNKKSVTQEDKPTIANAVKKFTSKERTEQAIRELIEYHVTEALKAAKTSIKLYKSARHCEPELIDNPFDIDGDYYIDEKSLANSYPLENIK